MKPVADEIAELRTLAVPELVERYVQVFGKTPRCKQPTWLFRKIAWEMQARRFGGLSKRAKERLEELIAEIDIPLDGARGQIKPWRRNGITLGTTVARIWKGREVHARSVERGWEHEGAVYRSLSAVAKHVTGSHWNGKLFFGLTRRAE